MPLGRWVGCLVGEICRYACGMHYFGFGVRHVCPDLLSVHLERIPCFVDGGSSSVARNVYGERVSPFWRPIPLCDEPDVGLRALHRNCCFVGFSTPSLSLLRYDSGIHHSTLKACPAVGAALLWLEKEFFC